MSSSDSNSGSGTEKSSGSTSCVCDVHGWAEYDGDNGIIYIKNVGSCHVTFWLSATPEGATINGDTHELEPGDTYSTPLTPAEGTGVGEYTVIVHSNCGDFTISLATTTPPVGMLKIHFEWNNLDDTVIIASYGTDGPELPFSHGDGINESFHICEPVDEDWTPDDENLDDELGVPEWGSSVVKGLEETYSGSSAGDIWIYYKSIDGDHSSPHSHADFIITSTPPAIGNFTITVFYDEDGPTVDGEPPTGGGGAVEVDSWTRTGAEPFSMVAVSVKVFPDDTVECDFTSAM